MLTKETPETFYIGMSLFIKRERESSDDYCRPKFT